MNSLSLMYIINTNLNEINELFRGVTPWSDMVSEPAPEISFV